MRLETLPDGLDTLDPRRQQAVMELTDSIKSRYPSASFALRSGIDDPAVTYIVVTVDIEDPDQVLDLVVDRLLALQFDEALPVFVIPSQTPERVGRTMRHSRHHLHAAAPLPAAL